MNNEIVGPYTFGEDYKQIQEKQKKIEFSYNKKKAEVTPEQIERVNQFTQQLNLTLDWIEPKIITRKQQWNSNPKKRFHSSHDNDIIFDGYIWCWSKNV